MKKRIVAIVMSILMTASCGMYAMAEEVPLVDSEFTGQVMDEQSDDSEVIVPELIPVSANEVEQSYGESSVSEDSVSGYNLETFCNEDLNDKEIESEGAGHSFNAATAVSVNKNVSDVINSDYRSNYYKFTIPAAGRIRIDFSHGLYSESQRGWRIKLYSANQEIIDSFSSTDGYSQKNSSPEIGLPAGTYYIYIDIGYSAYWAVGKTYTFNVNYYQTNDWEKEFNDDWLTATTINVNHNYSGSICERQSGSECDYYKFSLPTAGRIQIDFSHGLYSESQRGWRIKLYSANQEIIDSFSSTDGYSQKNSSPEIGLPAGTYYIYIDIGYSAYWAVGKTYTFNVNYYQTNDWEKEFNDDWLTATTINVNRNYSGSICERQSGSDDDYYKFSLPAAVRVRIDFSHGLYSESQRGWGIKLYSANQEIIDSFSSTDGYSQKNSSQEIGLPAGTYYIYIDIGYSAYWAVGKTYTFSVNTQPAVGTVASYNGLNYQITKDGEQAEVSCIGLADAGLTSVTIPEEIVMNEFRFKVTAIQSNAFKNYSNLKSITIGKGVKKIGSSAFSGCKKLKKIVIKSTALKTVGKKAFKGISKKATIKVPKAKYKAYVKKLKGKGQARTVKIKK